MHIPKWKRRQAIQNQRSEFYSWFPVHPATEPYVAIQLEGHLGGGGGMLHAIFSSVWKMILQPWQAVGGQDSEIKPYV